MKIKIVLSSLVAIALTLTNCNIALSEDNTTPKSKSDTSSEVCVDEKGNEYSCP